MPVKSIAKKRQTKKVRSVTSVKTVNGKSTVEKGIDPKVFNVEPCFVSFSMGRTVQTAPYESLKIDAGLTVPCVPDDVPKMYEKIVTQVERWLADKMKEYGRG